MGREVLAVAPPSAEVPMVEAEAVREMRELAGRGWGAKRIARELGLARNTVRRYLRGGAGAEVQERPAARRLDEMARAEAVALFDGAAEGNAVVVADLLAARGVEASVRTVQRAVAERRREQRAADLATVRFETAPGRQMQIDFGERKVWIAGERVTVHFLAAVLSYSRRGFVKAFLHERQGEWLDGIASAFRHFGGVPAEVLPDYVARHVIAVLCPVPLRGRGRIMVGGSGNNRRSRPHNGQSDPSQERSASSFRQTGAQGNASEVPLAGSQTRRAASLARTLISA
jgi:transposase